MIKFIVGIVVIVIIIKWIMIGMWRLVGAVEYIIGIIVIYIFYIIVISKL